MGVLSDEQQAALDAESERRHVAWEIVRDVDLPHEDGCSKMHFADGECDCVVDDLVQKIIETLEARDREALDRQQRVVRSLVAEIRR